METTRLGPLSGVAFIVLVMLAIFALAGETPGSDASGSELASFYGDSWRQFIAAFVLAASTPFLVVFGASIAGPAEAGERSIWRPVLIAGTALTAGVVLLQAFLHLALNDGGDQGVPGSALQAVNTLANSTWVAFFAALGVTMLGAAGCLIPSRGAHRWLGWAALVLGIALFFPIADFFAALLAAIWIVVASVVLARGTGQAAAESRLERGVSASAHHP